MANILEAQMTIFGPRFSLKSYEPEPIPTEDEFRTTLHDLFFIPPMVTDKYRYAYHEVTLYDVQLITRTIVNTKDHSWATEPEHPNHQETKFGRRHKPLNNGPGYKDVPIAYHVWVAVRKFASVQLGKCRRLRTGGSRFRTNEGLVEQYGFLDQPELEWNLIFAVARWKEAQAARLWFEQVDMKTNGNCHVKEAEAYDFNASDFKTTKFLYLPHFSIQAWNPWEINDEQKLEDICKRFFEQRVGPNKGNFRLPPAFKKIESNQLTSHVVDSTHIANDRNQDHILLPYKIRNDANIENQYKRMERYTWNNLIGFCKNIHGFAERYMAIAGLDLLFRCYNPSFEPMNEKILDDDGEDQVLGKLSENCSDALYGNCRDKTRKGRKLRDEFNVYKFESKETRLYEPRQVVKVVSFERYWSIVVGGVHLLNLYYKLELSKYEYREGPEFFQEIVSWYFDMLKACVRAAVTLFDRHDGSTWEFPPVVRYPPSFSFNDRRFTFLLPWLHRFGFFDGRMRVKFGSHPITKEFVLKTLWNKPQTPLGKIPNWIPWEVQCKLNASRNKFIDVMHEVDYRKPDDERNVRNDESISELPQETQMPIGLGNVATSTIAPVSCDTIQGSADKSDTGVCSVAHASASTGKGDETSDGLNASASASTDAGTGGTSPDEIPIRKRKLALAPPWKNVLHESSFSPYGYRRGDFRGSFQKGSGRPDCGDYRANMNVRDTRYHHGGSQAPDQRTYPPYSQPGYANSQPRASVSNDGNCQAPRNNPHAQSLVSEQTKRLGVDPYDATKDSVPEEDMEVDPNVPYEGYKHKVLTVEDLQLLAETEYIESYKKQRKQDPLHGSAPVITLGASSWLVETRMDDTHGAFQVSKENPLLHSRNYEVKTAIRQRCGICKDRFGPTWLEYKPEAHAGQVVKGKKHFKGNALVLDCGHCYHDSCAFDYWVDRFKSVAKDGNFRWWDSYCCPDCGAKHACCAMCLKPFPSPKYKHLGNSQLPKLPFIEYYESILQENGMKLGNCRMPLWCREPTHNEQVHQHHICDICYVPWEQRLQSLQSVDTCDSDYDVFKQFGAVTLPICGACNNVDQAFQRSKKHTTGDLRTIWNDGRLHFKSVMPLDGVELKFAARVMKYQGKVIEHDSFLQLVVREIQKERRGKDEFL